MKTPIETWAVAMLTFLLGSSAHVAEAACSDGCDVGYTAAGSCWCDDYCVNYADCCVDYAAECMAEPPPVCPGAARSWRASTLLQPRASTAFVGTRTFPDVGTASDGTAIVVWQWTNGPAFTGFRTSRFAAGTWSAASNLATGAKVSSRGLATRVAVGPRGHALVTYPNGGLARFRPAHGWSALPVSDFPTGRASLDRAVDSAGNLTYLFRADSSLHVRRNAGAAWQPSVALGLASPEPDLTGNAAGDFGLIYSPNYGYVMGRYEADAGSLTARATPLSASSGRAGIADDGTVISVWFGSGNSVISSRLTATAATPALTLASYATGAVSNLRLAVNATGKAIASWVHDAPDPLRFEIVAMVYTPGTGWSAATTVAPDAAETLYLGPPGLDVGIDGCGVAHLVHEDRGYKSYAFRYTPGAGWGPRHTFAGPAIDVRLSTAPDGTATAVWDNDQNEVLAARFQ